MSHTHHQHQNHQVPPDPLDQPEQQCSVDGKDSLTVSSLSLVNSCLWATRSAVHSGADSTDDFTGLHPTVRAAREEHLKSSLLIGDVARNPTLADHFQGYSLTDYFDDRGHRVFQNLSMSLAAKHHPDVGKSFGSTPIRDPNQDLAIGAKVPSARAYRLAAQTVQKDREAIRERNQVQFANLTDGQRVQWADVQARQKALFFYEMPMKDLVLPMGLTMSDVLPVTGTRTQEREDRRKFEKSNHDLLEGNYQSMHTLKNQKWLVQDHDVVSEIMNWISAWVAATGLLMQLGIDRSTFCAFILDLGLVHQEKLPYIWLVSLFDEKAKIMKVSPSDPDWVDPHLESRAPTMSVVSKWDLMSIIDVIVRRRFEPTQTGVAMFLRRLRGVGKVLKAEWERLEKEEAVAIASAATARAKATLSRTFEPNKPFVPAPAQRGRRRKSDTRLKPGASATLSSVPEAKTSAQQGPEAPQSAAPPNQKSTSNEASAIASATAATTAPGAAATATATTATAAAAEKTAAATTATATAATASGKGQKGNGKKEEAEAAARVSFDEMIPSATAVAASAAATSVFDTSSWKRFRRISAMMVEPEVSHLVEQHKSLFERLFSFYAHAEGGEPGSLTSTATMFIDFAGFLQFCQDFSLIPRVASKHEALCAFHAAICKETIVQLQVPTVPSAPAPSPNQPQRHTNPPSRKLVSRRTSNLTGAAAGRNSVQNSPRPSPPMTPSESTGTTASEATESLASALTTTTRTRHGLAAFIEALLRIVFGYLLGYGNIVQVSSSSRAKTVWLLVYLHQMFAGLLRSHGRRSKLGSAAQSTRPSTSTTLPPSSAGDYSIASTPLTPPSTAGGGGLSRRLVQALEEIPITSFFDTAPPPLQSEQLLERAPTPPSVRHRRLSESDLREEVVASQNQRSASPGQISAGSTSSRRRKRSARNGRLRNAGYTSQQGDVVLPDVPPLEPIPTDTFTIEELVLSRLLRTSSYGLPGWDHMSHFFDTNLCSTSGSVSSAGGESLGMHNPPPLFAKARTKTLQPIAHPASARQHHQRGSNRLCGVPNKPAHLDSPITAGDLRSERELLAWQLHFAAPSVDRCDLTPPPMNGLAHQIAERLQRQGLSGAATQ